jgi:hypothetical protein
VVSLRNLGPDEGRAFLARVAAERGAEVKELVEVGA